ncbi:hypothetical protein ACFWOG_27200 [Kitasatospora sp. NPDC058406]|uniref:hypothetical protein n=1 Tax=Kitasatospora sp. NPDC058406 TaxID=3346483 RepID=UPI00364A2511
MEDGLGPEAAVVAALLGDGAHQAVADVVRARLRMMPEGSQALAAAASDPQDPKARKLLTAAVARLLASDVAFAQYLATTELGKPSEPPSGPQTVQLRTGRAGAPPAKNPRTVQLRTGPRPEGPATVQLRMGPDAARAQLLAGRRSSAGIVVALALVLITSLVALGIHLSSRPLLKPGGPGLAHAAQPLRDPSLLRAVLPGEGAMPIGWRVQRAPESGTGPGNGTGAGSGTGVGTAGPLPCLPPDTCDLQLAYATVTFASASAQTVEFTAAAFTSPETAARAFDAMLESTPGEQPTAAVPRSGDQSALRIQGSGTAVALVRVGSTLLLVRGQGPGAGLTAPGLTLLTQLFAERARQAQDGLTPGTSARGTAG